MAVSKYFNHTANTAQQNFVNSLIVEAIQQRGINVNYLPRHIIEDNDALNEATIVEYSRNKLIEMYVEEVTNFNGAGSIFAKFGDMDFDDTMTLMVAQSRFDEELNQFTDKPKDGDLIHLPDYNKIFVVTKLLEDTEFQQWGQNYVWRIKCKVFKYGHENVYTDIDEVDDAIDLLDDEMSERLLGTIVETKDEVLNDPNDYVLEEEITEVHPEISEDSLDLGDIL